MAKRKDKARPREKGKPTEVLFGINPVTEAIKAGRRKMIKIVYKQGAHSGAMASLLSLAKTKRIPMEPAPLEKVAALAGAEGHQGIAAIVGPYTTISFDKLLDTLSGMENPVVAALDGVTDPRNLGAIIRSAECFGLAAVLVPQRRASGYTPVAAKASAGAGEHMRLCEVPNMAEAIRKLKEEGFGCALLDMDGKDMTGPAPQGPLVVVLGGEGGGARPLVARRCGAAVRIPMRGRLDSLNVSAAAAIAFHWVTSG